MGESVIKPVPTAGVPNTTSNATTPATFRNGDDIHFDYGTNAAQAQPTSSSSKKKKKKNKKKKKTTPSITDATITNPDEDYPTSRVIKQGPDGSVIVESLDEPKGSYQYDPATTSTTNGTANPTDRTPYKINGTYQHQLGNPVVDIWFHNSTPQEREDLKQFWEELDDASKQALSVVHKEDLLTLIRFDPKPAAKQGMGKDKVQERDLHAYASQNCTCTNCGRKRNLIVTEIERLYDEHMDDIHEFIRNTTNLNQLPNLPSILFDGYSPQSDFSHGAGSSRPPSTTNTTTNSPAPHSTIQPKTGATNVRSRSNSPSPAMNQSVSTTAPDLPVMPPFPLPEGVNEQVLHQFKEHFHDVLNSFSKEFNKLPPNAQKFAFHELNAVKKYLHENSVSPDEYQEITKMFHFFSKMDKIMEVADPNAVLPDPGTFKNGIAKLTDDIFQNDGRDFVEMMESLSKSRDSRGLIQEAAETKGSEQTTNIHDQIRKDALEFKRSTQKASSQRASAVKEIKEIYNQMQENHDYHAYEHQHHYHHDPDRNGDYPHEHPSDCDCEDLNDIDELEDEYGSIYDGSEGYEDEDPEDEYGEDEEGMEPEEDYEDELDDQSSAAESEVSDQEKLQELRHLFLMQVVRIFRQKLKIAYKNKLAQDRTQKLIEELEAEENAKKEKELKKLKQKEKAKEKKRLQQLAKEEEKKRKEEELRAKEEERKRKEEELKQEQRRRKEEFQRKKEEEKLKRIEEQQKKLALQRQKEEEERTKKEKEEEERIKREEEQFKKEKEEREQKRAQEQKKIEAEQAKAEEAERKRVEAEKTKEEQKQKQRQKQKDKEQQKEQQKEKQRLEQEAKAAEEKASQAKSNEVQTSNIVEDENDPAKAPNSLLQELYSRTSQSPTPKFDGQLFNSNASVLSTPPPAQSQNFAPPFPNLSTTSLAGNLSNPNVAGNMGFSDPFNDPFSSSVQTHTTPPGLSKISLNTPMNMGMNMNGLNSNALGSNLNQNSLGSNLGLNQMPHSNPQQISDLSSGFGLSSGLGGSPWTHSNSTTNTRNNSIWNSQSTGGSIWNGGSNVVTAQTNVPSSNVTPSSTPGPSIANAATNTAPTTAAATAGLQNLNLNGVASLPVVADPVTVLNATYQAFQPLKGANNDYPLLNSYPLYQTIVASLPSASLNFNQFLTTLSKGSSLVNYKFELVYDDFGTVNYIKLVDAPASPSHGMTSNLQPNLQPLSMGYNGFRPVNDNVSASAGTNGAAATNINGVNGNVTTPLTQPISLANNAFNPTRGLWN